MCKNFMMSNISNLTEKQFLKLRRLCLEVLTQGQDNDGFGYAAINQNGQVFGERFLDVKNVDFQMVKNRTPQVADLTPRVVKPRDVPMGYINLFEPDKIDAPKESNFWGTYSKPIGGFLAHARLSTSGVSMVNTHPHCTDKYTLIHNGVVQNAGKTYEWRSTCDSEFLVTHLTVGGLAAMVKGVTGNYAIGAIHNDTNELLIAKDSTNLYASYCDTIASVIISTSELHLKDIMKGMGFKGSKIRSLKDNHAWIFDVTGTLLSDSEITPNKRTYTPYIAHNTNWNDDYYNNWKKDDKKSSAVSVYEAAKSTRSTRLKSEAEVHGTSALDKEESHFYNKTFRFVKDGKDIGFKQWDRLPYFEQSLCIVIDRESGKAVNDFA